MSELVADCSRCGAKRITFDLTQENLVGVKYSWQQWYEVFCVCRNCQRATIYLLSQNVDAEKESVQRNGLVKQSGSVCGGQVFSDSSIFF